MYIYFFLLLSLVSGVKSNQEEKDLINYNLLNENEKDYLFVFDSIHRCCMRRN